jgi:hypothetical protein
MNCSVRVALGQGRDRAGPAERPELGSFPQVPARDGAGELGSDEFAYRVSRQAAGEGHEGGDLVGGEMLSAPGQKFLFGSLHTGRQDNESCRYRFVPRC